MGSFLVGCSLYLVAYTKVSIIIQFKDTLSKAAKVRSIKVSLLYVFRSIVEFYGSDQIVIIYMKFYTSLCIVSLILIIFITNYWFLISPIMYSISFFGCY